MIRRSHSLRVSLFLLQMLHALSQPIRQVLELIQAVARASRSTALSALGRGKAQPVPGLARPRRAPWFFGCMVDFTGVYSAVHEEGGGPVSLPSFYSETREVPVT